MSFNVTNSTLLEDDSENFQNFIYDKVLIVAISSIAFGMANSFIETCCRFLVVLFCIKMKTTGSGQGSTMDTLASKGICENREVSHSYTPGNGLILFWEKGPVFAIKRKGYDENSRRYEPFSKYVIYSLRITNSASSIEKHLLGDPREINIIWVESGSSSSWSMNSLRHLSPKNPYDWQIKIAKEFCKSYKIKNNASGLICGAPGLGKSRLCEVLAQMMKNELGSDPCVVRGASLTDPGFTLSHIATPSRKNPVIIVFDEYDVAILHAEECKEKDGKFKSIAKNSTSLLNFLDKINDTVYIIFFATSNVNLVDLEKIKQSAYVRKGRVNLKFQIGISQKSEKNNPRNATIKMKIF